MAQFLNRWMPRYINDIKKGLVNEKFYRIFTSFVWQYGPVNTTRYLHTSHASPGQDSNEFESNGTKVIHVSVIGEPNSGKSTLINALVGAKVSIVTEVPHTTRRALSGVYTSDTTQIVISDTPGIVNYQEGKRLNMDRMQVKSASSSAEESDLIAVIVDASNKSKRDRIHEALLDILHCCSNIPSILILNKIDRLNRKGILLALASDLLKDRGKDAYGHKATGGYSKFEHIFMVSALTGDGVGDVRDYLLARAKAGKWEFPSNVQLDASVEEQITELIREKVLQLFDKEIPWQFRQETVALDQFSDGTVRLCKKLIWPKKSQKRYVESKLKTLHTMIEEDLKELLDCPVELILNINTKKNMTKSDLFSHM